jgi:hypothetical protein
VKVARVNEVMVKVLMVKEVKVKVIRLKVVRLKVVRVKAVTMVRVRLLKVKLVKMKFVAMVVLESCRGEKLIAAHRGVTAINLEDTSHLCNYCRSAASSGDLGQCFCMLVL